jgi:hypothetical protein
MSTMLAKADTKFRAKVVYWNLVTKNVVSAQSVEQYRVNNRLKLPDCICRFDSQLEFKVYLELVRMYGAEKIIRQYPLEIFPESYCYPRGKVWKVDFAIKRNASSYLPSLFVEAKGAFLPEFAVALAAFEALNPDDFDKVHIIFGNTFPKESRVFRNLLKCPIANQMMTINQLRKKVSLT